MTRPDADERLRGWLEAFVATPGLTAITDLEEAWAVHVDDSLAALDVLRATAGPVVDVGSGGGAPGIPLAAALPEREFTLLEANGRKCEFLERWTSEFPNVRVVRGRAEEQPVDSFGVAVAKALAPPAVAAEWCLPLVVPGGAVILYMGKEAAGLDSVAAKLGGGPAEVHAVPGSERRRLVVIRKLEPTPAGFPRRPGIARKRPLA